MTLRQVRARVDYWQKRLNLTHWKLTIHNSGAADNAVAMIDPAGDYDRGHLYVNLARIDNDENINLDHVIVHELLHLMFRDLDKTYRHIEDHLGPPVWSIHEAQMEREIEGIVDRLATLLSKT